MIDSMDSESEGLPTQPFGGPPGVGSAGFGNGGRTSFQSKGLNGMTEQQVKDLRDPAGAGCFVTAPDESARSRLFEALVTERATLNPEQTPHLYRLIEREIARVANSPDAENTQEVDLYSDRNITLNVKCYPPARISSGFNYAGRVIGPKGTYLKALMKETMTKIVILGSGVMRDKEKEIELKKSKDPRYMHLHDDMYFSLTVCAPAIDAYERLGYAMACLKRQVLSDSRDLVRLPWIAAAIENGAPPPPNMTIPQATAAAGAIMPMPTGDFGNVPPIPKGRGMPPPYMGVPAPEPYYGGEVSYVRRGAPPRPAPVGVGMGGEYEYFEEYSMIPRNPMEYPRPPPSVAKHHNRRVAVPGYPPVRPRAPAPKVYDYEHQLGNSGDPGFGSYAEMADDGSWSEGDPGQPQQPQQARARPRYVPYPNPNAKYP